MNLDDVNFSTFPSLLQEPWVDRDANDKTLEDYANAVIEWKQKIVEAIELELKNALELSSPKEVDLLNMILYGKGEKAE